MKKPQALIVDDEPDIRELLEITLERMDVTTLSAECLKTARTLLKQHRFDLCLTDMKLPDGDGLDLVEYLQLGDKPTPVAVITAHGSMDTAIRAMKAGAFDFIAKPLDLPVLRQIISKALLLRPEVNSKDKRTRHILLGESAAMCQVRSKIEKLARSQAPVYISGESGSGKELVARLIHQQSPRSDKPFIAVNCGAIPHELMESEFFGHRKGSFSGAIADKTGLFQAAESGTLFLDEVADLPQSLQVKLLRAIQEKKVRKVGDSQEIPVDVRILSATHRDLGQMVQTGQFRQDLYYRINVIDLNIPPLRQRGDDIIQLTRHILATLNKSSEQQPPLSEAALLALRHYAFPGNVRELENILERAMALSDGKTIEVEDLNLPSASNGAENAPELDPAQTSLEDYLPAIEKKVLVAALESTQWDKASAAEQLGLSFKSLHYRLKKLGLN
ncbi:MAG: sigma-54-dependent Fis family transcriptional regulator [Gammaproteobacteria bacterium HGW-Gammaproteobacteria-10]|nr:MAG: sigma-54-dependent Fis family transcriptional regulator [Gammaproteobacteria bacterium HGW-Gammaproteobacteria-3]PKM35926.1 MAG: sigma-54-dependent Fis family transcriptional regulator [Gammaproteobacteria bacterium HGW-Gammaproteobacteria-10]